jgi:UDP-2,3-diacylglucosamine hydrolase
VDAAATWLQRLVADFPRCEIHYVLGNHDCLTLFRERLQTLCATEPRLHWHEHHLRLGSTLFLHGDCTVGRMDLAALRAYRCAWEQDRQRGRVAGTAYLVADRLGLTRLVHDRHFPRERTVKRLAHHLDHTQAGWREQIRDCYFGHTHLPFSAHQYAGVNFHNTGSAIRSMEFKPIRFAIPAGNGATCGTT